MHALNGRHASWLTTWHGMVTVAGIAFGAVLVLMTLAFLCYHRVSGASRRPRKTQVGQVLLRPRGAGNHDPRSRRADGASASLWSDRTASPAESPTRTFLLTSSRNGSGPRHPAYYVDGPFPPADVLESNVDTLGRPCPAYRIYGFPAYYGSPQGEATTGCYYDVPACANCSQRRSHSPGVAYVGGSEPGASFPGGYGYENPPEEVFIDGPPQQDGHEGGGTGRQRRRPPTEGSDSELTPVKTVPRPTGAPAWKRPDRDEEGSYVPPRGSVKPEERKQRKRPELEEEEEGSYGDPQEMPDHNEVERSDAEVEGTYVGLEQTVRPVVLAEEHREAGKRPDREAEPRRAVRPDGQSPDGAGGAAEPAAAGTKPTAATSCSTLSELDVSAADELEYDDYIPQLPGSYFEMDPHAYTLTWSQQPAPPDQQRNGSARRPPHHGGSLSASEASLDCR